MTSSSERQSAAEIQRDIEDDRRRIEESIDVIQERMSPGQLIDEVLGYLKSSGGGAYVANLGNAVKNDPIPVALMGVSLAWLMAGTGTGRVDDGKSISSFDKRPEHPLATVDGDIRWMGPALDEGDAQYMHFADSAGNRFRALTNNAGKRAGPFLDDSGKSYRGFADAAGNRIEAIKDQAGAIWDDASDWLSDTYQQVSDAAAGVADRVSSQARSVGDTSASAGAAIRDQTKRLNETILTHFRDQPLVGGALAFAVGAAIGAALPHTAAEDAAVGEAAQNLRDRVSEKAEEIIDKGKAAASDIYEQTVDVADDVYDAALDRIKDSGNAGQS
ncbi:DUF3618 domain-containing protein [Phyllobacterium sophorae]|uniref:Nutrient deprivation-induced protein n=1 Tax=Phyllobacterium sophorae TaxID=1520277 RepID=A0A2P7B561_9HYPH|nr:DUF3618 domain-containing protein [Phyllobacterium sophorae]PSH61601.1 nutrient deprivation-induced protein [Phyllobacterium sophorae]